MESLCVVSVLGKIPANGVDVNPIFEGPGTHSTKTLETQHHIIVKELTTSLILRREQRWDLIHSQLCIFVGQNFLALVLRRFMSANACTRYLKQ